MAKEQNMKQIPYEFEFQLKQRVIATNYSDPPQQSHKKTIDKI